MGDKVGDEIALPFQQPVLPGRASPLALLLHQLLEPFLVHGQLVFRRHQLSQVERKTVRIVQLERVVARKYRLLVLLQRFDTFIEEANPAVNGRGKAFFLGVDRPHDFVAVLLQLRKRRSHDDFQHREQLGHERFLEADLSPVTDRAA